jgi:hypothetical protein
LLPATVSDPERAPPVFAGAVSETVAEPVPEVALVVTHPVPLVTDHEHEESVVIETFVVPPLLGKEADVGDTVYVQLVAAGCDTETTLPATFIEFERADPALALAVSVSVPGPEPDEALVVTQPVRFSTVQLQPEDVEILSWTEPPPAGNDAESGETV